MILVGKTFAECGTALFGDDWEGTMSKKLGVSRKTVIRWRDGKCKIAPGIKAKLLDMFDSQQNLLAAQRRSFDRA
jgi:hypothetical protein